MLTKGQSKKRRALQRGSSLNCPLRYNFSDIFDKIISFVSLRVSVQRALLFRFDNVRSLLMVIGPKLQKLTVECDEEQGSG